MTQLLPNSNDYYELGTRFNYFLLPKYFPNLKIGLGSSTCNGCLTVKTTPSVFEFFTPKQLNTVANSPDDTFFVFSQEDEGRDSKSTFDMLYTCEKYGVPRNKILYLTGNLLDIENLKKYHQERFGDVPTKKNSINILQFFWATSFIDPILNYPNEETFRNDYIHNNLFLQASRMNRPHRVYANYIASTSNHRKYFSISQDKLSMDDYGNRFYTKDMYDWSDNCLPLTIDRTDFDVNWGWFLSKKDPYKYITSALSQVVMETTYDPKILFFSEKTVNAIMCNQLFVVYGNPNSNRYLQSIGLETYNDIFNFESFDSLETFKERYDKLFKNISYVIKNLKSLSKSAQINFKELYAEKYKHNRNLLSSYINIGNTKPEDIPFITKHGKVEDYYFTNSPARDIGM